MKFNDNAGHTLTGGDIGSRGINGIKEETLTRGVIKEVDNLLKVKGHTVYNCTVDSATSLNDSLNKQVALCNSHNVDFNIVVHFNAYNGNARGAEIYTYGGKKLPQAVRILNNLEALGFIADNKVSRGIKSAKLALLQRTNAKTIYIEVCFIDNEKDYKILQEKGYKEIARAIVAGVLGEKFELNSQQDHCKCEEYKDILEDIKELVSNVK